MCNLGKNPKSRLLGANGIVSAMPALDSMPRNSKFMETKHRERRKTKAYRLLKPQQAISTSSTQLLLTEVIFPEDWHG